MTETISRYIQRFSQLRTDRTGRWTAATNMQAPHKPFLLLSVIELFAAGQMPRNLIEITPELGQIFSSFWNRAMPPERKGNIALPFFHLRSSHFWHLVPIPGQEKALETIRQVDSLGQLNRLILGASLDLELYSILQSEAERCALQDVLIQTYFAPEVQLLLREQSQIQRQSTLYSDELLKKARRQIKDAPTAQEQYQAVVRDQGFRRAVTRIYDHRCAVCGLRLLTSEGRTVVDAAHIVPWRVSQEDDPHNGLALCRLCHWAFDQGLVGISSKYLVLLSGELRTTDNVPGHLLTLEKRPIIGPLEEELWPWLDSLDWHRQNVYRIG
jgi:putative restriction endonuclease